MAKNQIAPERAHKNNEKFVEKAKKVKSNMKVTKRDKFFTPSVSGSRTFFSKSNKEPSTQRNSKPNDFFIKSNMKFEKPENVSDKILTAKEKSNGLDKTKKPFDKKKYRLQKYSKKYKLQQWEDRRKHAILQEYYRQIKDDQPMDVSKIYEDPRNQDSEDDNVEEENQNNLNAGTTGTQGDLNYKSNNPAEKKAKPFQRAQQEFQRIKEEKLRKKEEIMRGKAEKQEAMKKYKKEKVEKYKKLSRKTKKGQPIMKDRIEMLLEKIQNSMK